MKSLSYPVKYFDITSNYGYRTHPITGIYNLHNGLDISAPLGTEIRAQADGIVDKIFINPIGGLQLRIKYKNGITGGYAHLSTVEVAQNQTVSRGELIAYTGESGAVTGPHLHYTLSENGQTFDPLSIKYTPYRNNKILANMPLIPFQDPKFFAVLVLGTLIINRLFKK